MSKLLNTRIVCGGPDGCGMVFQFLETSTTEEAARVLREHRAEKWHADAAKSEREFRESVALLKEEFPEAGR